MFILFSGNKVVTKVVLDEAVSFIRTHHESSLIAIALEDFTVHLLDIETRVVVRKFFGHSAQLTDATFSPDSRWLITSSMDCTIKVWNIPTGQLIDHFQTEAACTSVSMSPTGELLATAHVDYLGVFLWANKSLYAHLTLKALEPSDKAPLVELPDCATEQEDQVDEEIEQLEPEFVSPEQIDGLITFSNIANSRWQNLLTIDMIKRRNKPKAPPKVPQAAPFFLPTIPSLDFKFDLSSEETETEGKIMKANSFVDLTPFGKLLQTTKETKDFDSVVEKLKSFGPSMIDFEIKSLSPEGLGSVDVMLQFLKCIEYMFETSRDFELAQAYLGVFVKSHARFIATERILRDYLPIVSECQKAGWKKLQDKLLYNLCVVQSLKIM